MIIYISTMGFIYLFVKILIYSCDYSGIEQTFY
jgi:hypothetical protein